MTGMCVLCESEMFRATSEDPACFEHYCIHNGEDNDKGGSGGRALFPRKLREREKVPLST